MRKPDFANLEAVLRRQTPSRPTLFEFFLNAPLYDRLTGKTISDYLATSATEEEAHYRRQIDAFYSAGYDYATVSGFRYRFPTGAVAHIKSKSLNDGALITDRDSFAAYVWPDPEEVDYGALEALSRFLQDGMKFVVGGPCGVLENTIALVGYDNMCIMSIEEPELLQEIFDAVGSRLLTYYQRASVLPSVGALIGNDDWGFNRQTMLSPADMRKYVFPWHKKIVATIHDAGKLAILHSCGNLERVMDDVIDDIGYDAKHSFEDNIQPIEEAYEQYGHRIALLGGIDLDFVCRRPLDEIKRRATAMIERTSRRGGWALGTGNSVPEYVPQESYRALITCATGQEPLCW